MLTTALPVNMNECEGMLAKSGDYEYMLCLNTARLISISKQKDVPLGLGDLA